MCDEPLPGARLLAPPCVEVAYAEAEALRQGVDPSGLAWMPAANPAAAVVAAGPERSDGVCVTWEAGGAHDPVSRFEGKLELRGIDPDRTELRLRGRLRPPRPVAESDAHLAERLSQATMRSALRHIAHTIETTPAVSASR